MAKTEALAEDLGQSPNYSNIPKLVDISKLLDSFEFVPYFAWCFIV